MVNIKHTAELENLEAFKLALEDFLQSKSIEKSRISDIELAVEELLVNIMSYSYPDKAGSVELYCEEREKYLICRITDEGIPFDPTASADPELSAPLSSRTQGGMGIYLAKKLVDKITYCRSDNKNILTLFIYK